MGDSENFPVSRDVASTTVSVADRIAALALPSIMDLGTDIHALGGLPDLPVPGTAPDAGGGSRLGGVRAVMNECIDGLLAVVKLQNQCAGLTAELISMIHAAEHEESALLDFDRAQQGWEASLFNAEIALCLGISEARQVQLSRHALLITGRLPDTREQLRSGDLGWEHARIIADEVQQVHEAGAAAEAITVFESTLLAKAVNSTVTSFRQKARRLRERCYPETLTPRTRRAYANRSLSVNHGEDGMSWLTLYGPSPSIDAIWAQCTQTAQNAQGPHEPRTLTQLRADVATTLLLGQTMTHNHIHTPPPNPNTTGNAGGTNTTTGGTNTGGTTSTNTTGVPGTGVSGACQCSGLLGCEGGFVVCGRCEGGGTVVVDYTGATVTLSGARRWASETFGIDPRTINQGPFLPPEETLHDPGLPPDEHADHAVTDLWQVPRYENPDYSDPAFRDPPPWDTPDWPAGAQPPHLTPAPGSRNSGNSNSNEDDGTVTPGLVEAPAPLPPVKAILLIPALALLGFTADPAWLEGVGPISMDVAKELTRNESSLYRVLTDPLTAQPLDCAPEKYRITTAMRTMLRIRDEYCLFPNCNARAMNSQTDHIKKFQTGGRTVMENIEHLCRKHHTMKHFKDDRTTSGHLRTQQSPERQAVTLRGWTPTMTPNGTIAWTTPTGRLIPPESPETPNQSYPDWVKDMIIEQLRDHHATDELENDIDPDTFLQLAADWAATNKEWEDHDWDATGLTPEDEQIAQEQHDYNLWQQHYEELHGTPEWPENNHTP